MHEAGILFPSALTTPNSFDNHLTFAILTPEVSHDPTLRIKWRYKIIMGKTYQSIVIHRPADKVWQKLSDFHDMSWAPQSIEKVEAAGDIPGDKPGAKRILNDAFQETLQAIDHEDLSLEYSIDEGPSPVSSKEVSDYQGVVRVRPVTESEEGTFVEWFSTWRGNDEDAAEFCHTIYASLLKELKTTLESGNP